jgi:mannan endo-1,6-alpha-mannosidase
MYNVTNGSSKWKVALDGLLGSFFTDFFPSGDIAAEVSCESIGKCNTDLESYKSYAARWLASTVQMVPCTYSLILPKLKASAQAAAKTSDSDGSGCGLVWTGADNNKSTGLGEQMDALAFVQSLLVDRSSAPLTAGSSGSSSGSSSNTTSGATPGSSGTGSASTPSTTSKPSSAVGTISGTVSLYMSFTVVGLLAFLAM